MKSKVIKKILWILLYFIGGLLFLFISGYYALRSPAFQTWATNRAAWYFSTQWGTTVRVEGVDIEFWKKIVLEGVYVEDQHSDTLLYAEKLKVDIGTFDLDSQKVFIRDVRLQNAVVKLKQYKGDTAFNFQFIIDEFTSKDTAKTDTSAWKIKLDGVTLDNMSFVYKIESDTSKVKGVNFSDISALYVNGKISGLSFAGDTTYCTINTFSLVEKSGFILKKLSAGVSVSPVLLKLDDLKVHSNKSNIGTDLSFQYKSFNDFSDFVEKVKIRSQFRNSDIEMEDVAYFAPGLYGISKKVFLDGTVNGKVGDLKGRNIILRIGNETIFKGNFDMAGLPDIDQTFMSFDAKELMTSKAGIESIPLPPFNEKNFISLPDNISLFGAIKFKGNFTGFYNDFVSYGKFTTALGHISTDISLKSDTVTGRPAYHGKFACSDFNLGKFLDSERSVGKLSMNAIVDGKGFTKKDAVATVEGVVSSLELNGYNYRNIDLEGKLARNVFNGILAVNDENLKLDFNGEMDFSQSPTHVNFMADVSKANLTALNIVKSVDTIGVTAKIDVNAVGNTIDDVVGEMKLEDIVYLKGEEVFKFKDMTMVIEDNAGIKTIDFNSSIADAHLNGKFMPLQIASSMNNFLNNYLPAYIPLSKQNGRPGNAKKAAEYSQQFTFDIDIHNTDMVTAAFAPSMKVGYPSTVKGSYDEKNKDLSFIAEFPSFSIQDYKFKKCVLQASGKSTGLDLQANCQRLALSDSVWIDSINVASAIARDTANFRINWHNSSQQKYEGDIPGFIAFSGYPKVKLKLHPSRITIADSTWTLNTDNEVVMDSTFISIKNIDFISGNQRVKLEGNISEVKGEQVYLMLTSFSLETFNNYLRGSGFSVYGTISGNTSIGNVYDKPLFGSSLDIKGLKVNKESIGDGSLVSVYDSKAEMINFNGSFDRGSGENLKLSGNYYPLKKENSLTADIEVRDFRLEFFDPFVKDFVENLRGIANAEFKVTGTPSVPLVTGKVNAKVNNVHVNYLGTDYHFDGDITVEPTSFDFAHLTVYDVNNNKANIVNGKLFHNNFKEFQLDVDMNVNKFLALNTVEKDNPTFYGKVYVTGIVNIFGFLDRVNLSASLKTDKAKNQLGKIEYSQLFIPLSGSEEVGEYSYISFVKKDTLSKTPKYNVTMTGFTMDFRLQPTADAQVQLIFDEKVGDIIKANGTGDIRMVINEFGDFKMFGEYMLDEGDYLFTLKNVVNKRFRLVKGGTISWSGSPENADIDMSAVYQLRTSLTPLFPSYEQTDIIKKRYPVDCVMNLSGKLLEPNIAFQIQMPTLDDFTREQAYAKISNTEAEINKQVFSLMFTNSFTPPPQVQETSSGPGVETVTSTEMLSNQLSNWLSQISNEFDVGVHYYQGDSLNASQVELALSTQLFNDKLTIDGSVSNSANTTNSSQNAASVVGDINVDYKLTEDGKFRAKAYNKSNESDVINIQKGPYTQGVGLLYREEFETFRELFNRFRKKIKGDPEKKAARKAAKQAGEQPEKQPENEPEKQPEKQP